MVGVYKEEAWLPDHSFYKAQTQLTPNPSQPPNLPYSQGLRVTSRRQPPWNPAKSTPWSTLEGILKALSRIMSIVSCYPAITLDLWASSVKNKKKKALDQCLTQTLRIPIRSVRWKKWKQTHDSVVDNNWGLAFSSYLSFFKQFTRESSIHVNNINCSRSQLTFAQTIRGSDWFQPQALYIFPIFCVTLTFECRRI